MDRFLNAVKAHAAALDHGQAQPRFGIVASVDQATSTARVQLQPENVLSGWLPVLSPWVGAGWGMFCPPSPGDQVLVIAQEGAANHGVIIGSAFSASKSPPAGSVGELWLTHSSGTSLKLCNDGTVHVDGPLTVHGTVLVTGDLKVEGTMSDAAGSLARLRAHYDLHTHRDSLAGITTTPTPQD